MLVLQISFLFLLSPFFLYENISFLSDSMALNKRRGLDQTPPTFILKSLVLTRPAFNPIHRVRTTVEPRSTDTRLIRTPRYYGQFCLSRRKAHSFLKKKTSPAFYGQRSLFCVPSDKLLQIVNPALRTLFTWALFIVIDTIPVPATIFELASTNMFPRFARSKLFKSVWTNAMTDTGVRD